MLGSMAIHDIDSISSPKRTPRKRVVRRVAPKKETIARDNNTVSTARKAPVRPVFESSKESKGLIKYVVIGGFAIAVLGGAAWVGFSDKGQIDVSARTLETKNQAAQDAANAARANGDTSQGEVIPVQDTPPVIPASAMMPSNSQPSQNLPAALVEVPSEEASSTEPVVEEDVSTDETATTTDDR